MLHHEVAGEGPGVALLHSTACDSRMWDAEFAALAERCQVLRYDFRGFGRSPMPAEDWSSVDDLRGLLDDVGMERPALVGLSGGALVALDFALAEPDRVRGLVLAAPAVGGLPWVGGGPTLRGAGGRSARGRQPRRGRRTDPPDVGGRPVP